MFTRKIYRDPAAEAGGGAPAAAPEAPAQQPIVTPTSYGGSSSHADYQDPYDDPKFQAQIKPQPPANSGNAPAATATGIQGGEIAQPQAGGDSPASDTSTTALQPGQAATGTGAWSPEGQKYLESLQAKDPVFKDLPFHPAVEKLAMNTRELEAKFTQGQQYLGTVNQTIEDYKTVMQSGDPAEIAKVVEYFGGEVQFDVRKSEDVVKEIQTGYQDLVEVFRGMAEHFPAEAIPAINRALDAYAQQLNGKVQGIQDKKARRDEIRQEIAKITGVQAPKIGNPYERYKEPAKAHMTTLEREFNDPNFWAYYNEIKDAFAAPDPKTGFPGGHLHAQGLTAGKAFGASLDSARYWMNQAKASWLAKNLPSVVSQHEQTWLKKHQGNGAVAPPPKGAGAVTAPQSQDKSLQAYEKAMEEHMNRRNGV